MAVSVEMTGMDLHLIQHGEATTDVGNPERPLTDAGRAENGDGFSVAWAVPPDFT